MSVSAIQNTNAAEAASQSAASAAANAASTSTLANENVFMQLLVAQLQYQDPDNPTTGTEFVTQLAQFSDLANTTEMASDLDAIKAAIVSAAPAAPASPSTAPTSPTTGSPQTPQSFI